MRSELLTFDRDLTRFLYEPGLRSCNLMEARKSLSSMTYYLGTEP